VKPRDEMLIGGKEPKLSRLDPHDAKRNPNGSHRTAQVIDLTTASGKRQVVEALNSSLKARSKRWDKSEELSVLLVEDSDAEALLVQEMLREVSDFSFEIIHASRAAEVSPLLMARSDIACVLLDLSLPDARGLSGLMALRESSPALPIVVLTGFDDKEMALQALQQGAQDYIVKGSVDGELLSRSIRYAIERKRLESEIAHEALHDPLTGLPNRRLFLDRVTSAFTRLHRSPGLMALLFVDLDRFKAVNDNLGHEAGDELLITVAHRIEEAIRPSDTVGRFGGDELTILCENISGEKEAVSIGERVGDSLRRPFRIGDNDIEITASIGIVVGSGREEKPQELIGAADTAMYEAKLQGKARTIVFDRALAKRASDRLGLEGDLEEAIDSKRFELFFQPQVSIKTGLLEGAEALLRWDHPVRGQVEPQTFVSVAEETGLIGRLGAWALHEATRRASGWRVLRAASPTGVAVNISPRQLADPGLTALVQTAIVESGIEPDRLCLEITEKAVITDLPAAKRVLDDLKALGVRLALDDFGTGYASLVYVKQLPIDILKIDRSFVDGLGRDVEDSAIVTAVINLAHTLGMGTIAEGVETPKQLSELRAYGCDAAQGMLFSPAVPTHELLSLFAPRNEISG
jgi:diguanylate cyclase